MPLEAHVVVGRAARRAARAVHVQAVLSKEQSPAALDLLELTEFAWHDCYREITPPDEVIDDIHTCSRGDFAKMIRAAKLAVIDLRDLRMAADAIRAETQ